MEGLSGNLKGCEKGERVNQKQGTEENKKHKEKESNIAGPNVMIKRTRNLGKNQFAYFPYII